MTEPTCTCHDRIPDDRAESHAANCPIRRAQIRQQQQPACTCGYIASAPEHHAPDCPVRRTKQPRDPRTAHARDPRGAYMRDVRRKHGDAEEGEP